MNSKPTNDMTQDVFNQLKARYDADPASLTIDEKAALLLAGASSIMNKESELKDVCRAAKAKLKRGYDQAYELLDRYEKGTYDGLIALDLEKLVPEDSELLALRLGDDALAVRIAKIAQRYMEIDKVKRPDPSREELEEFTYASEAAKKIKAEEEAVMVKDGWKPGTDKFRDELMRRVGTRRMMGDERFKESEQRKLDRKLGKKVDL
jgi:hypothetical protein